ncbi:DNA-directed DNA polymerase [Acididesulfobacillus acetoxydans]|uniref:DNA polymerase III PolC-type n=1 Tax=Acididesulfobacillus acetoxydans TaxID=1561005 RepID=A0A8S0VY32_9FIRM|nr:PolC-type DNA polymerase III [Acididesulfobacillus acetoxydans]CAA7602543.1 DNA-directed DNA polymerase [Acididesulfobacillus acetoxydans]CEJ07311.1 DNA polymerase III PolC-type [Acididesulfobacillus acetoxydans]
MARLMPLAEVPLLSRFMPTWRERLGPVLDLLALKRVEVYPEKKKWIFHLYSPCEVDECSLGPLREVLEGNAPGIGMEWHLECPEGDQALAQICSRNWPRIVRELGESFPAMKGWLGSGYEIRGETLVLPAPNALGVEYFQLKQAQVEEYFFDTFGIRLRIRCEYDPGRQEPDYDRLTEQAEKECLERLMAPAPEKKAPPRSDCILGKEIEEEPVPLRSIVDEERRVVLTGRVFALEQRQLKSGRKLTTFNLTDRTDSMSAKVFGGEKAAPLDLRDGEWIKAGGPVQFDRFSGELTFMPKDMVRVSPMVRVDQAAEKRVELHLHTRMSAMDGISSAEDLIRRAGLWGHAALAITDHGVVQAFPEAVEAGKKYGVKIILGVEGYLIDDISEPSTPPQQMKSRHMVLLVRDAVGLKNLYKLITCSHLEYFHRRPRIPKSVLARHRTGLIIGSACEAGELVQAILKQEPWEKLLEVASFYDYLEIQPRGNNAFMLRSGLVRNEEGLRELNRTVLRLGRALNKPVAATGDVHFLDPEDEAYRRILMAGKGFEDADDQAPLYFRTTEEMLEEFSYLGETEAFEVVVRAPQHLAAQVEVLKPFPDDLFSPTIPGAEEKIESMSWQRARELYGRDLPDVVRKRLEKELNAIIGHGFSVLYLIAHLLVKKSNEDGYLVGSRGSVGSSLVATLTGITEVNPLPPHYRCLNPECLHSIWVEDGSAGSGVDLADKDCPRCGGKMAKDGHDIPFETFLGFKGDKVPDIDLNFSGDYQPKAHKFTEELFGRDNVFRAGTIATIADKTAYGYVKNYLEERQVKVRSAEMARLVEGCTGVKRTTGQHPGGLMVVPKECDVFDFTPLQRPADDPKSETVTTHFDYHSISGRLVKLDILGHDDPTVIKMLEDLTGVNAKTIPLDDPKTLSLFWQPDALGVSAEEICSNTGTYGIPEFGTKFVRQMLEDTRPQSFSDLVRISGLSHGTDVWLGNAQDLVRSGTATISEIIACRDDIMVYLIYRGLEPGRAFKIMEGVRKGKGLKAEDIEEMRQHQVPEWYIKSCQKIKYMFPKAHAVAYVTMAFRIAWFKVYYPQAFYATFFTVRADEFDLELILRGKDACRAKIKEIEGRGNEATAKEKNLVTILELVVEMYSRGVCVRPVDLWESDATRFKVTPTGLLPPFAAIQGMGSSAAQNVVRLRDTQGILSVEELHSLAKLSAAVIEVLGQMGCLKGLPEENQLSLFS